MIFTEGNYSRNINKECDYHHMSIFCKPKKNIKKLCKYYKIGKIKNEELSVAFILKL